MAYLDTALKLEEIPVGKSRCVQLGDVQVGLFRGLDGLFAINNECPHRGGPLHEGLISEGHVACPWHQWEFQLADGVCKNIPKVRTATYPVEVRDGAIWVDLQVQGTSES